MPFRASTGMQFNNKNSKYRTIKIREIGGNHRYSLQHEANLFKLSSDGLKSVYEKDNDVAGKLKSSPDWMCSGFINYFGFIDLAEIRACKNEKGERVTWVEIQEFCGKDCLILICGHESHQQNSYLRLYYNNNTEGECSDCELCWYQSSYDYSTKSEYQERFEIYFTALDGSGKMFVLT